MQYGRKSLKMKQTIDAMRIKAKNTQSVLVGMLVHGDTVLLELYMSFLLIIFGVWFLIPFDSFSGSPIFNSFVFEVLDHYTGELLLGIFSILIGIVKLLSVLHSKQKIDIIANIAAIVLWGTVWMSAVIGRYFLVATVVYASFFFVSIYLHIRIGDKRE